MYPMPLVDEELAAINGAQWVSTMDLMKGFYRTDDEGKEHVISYASKKLSGSKCNWSATDGECFAALWGITKFHHFLHGSKFIWSLTIRLSSM